MRPLIYTVNYPELIIFNQTKFFCFSRLFILNRPHFLYAMKTESTLITNWGVLHQAVLKAMHLYTDHMTYSAAFRMIVCI